MNLYKIEVLVNGLCKEICYVAAYDLDRAKKLVIQDYQPINIEFKNISKVYGNIIIGD